mgnify:CR=1 FL=1
MTLLQSGSEQKQQQQQQRRRPPASSGRRAAAASKRGAAAAAATATAAWEGCWAITAAAQILTQRMVGRATAATASSSRQSPSPREHLGRSLLLSIVSLLPAIPSVHCTPYSSWIAHPSITSGPLEHTSAGGGDSTNSRSAITRPSGVTSLALHGVTLTGQVACMHRRIHLCSRRRRERAQGCDGGGGLPAWLPKASVWLAVACLARRLSV